MKNNIKHRAVRSDLTAKLRARKDVGGRALTVTAAGLVDSGESEEQLDIFSTPEKSNGKQESVEKTMADIRGKHGHASIRLGCYENTEIGTGHQKD